MPTAFGSFSTHGNGTFEMTNGAEVLTIGGDAYFGGGSTASMLTAGTINLAGNLNQSFATDPQSFHPTGTNKLVLNGTGLQGLWFSSPGDVLTNGTYALGDSRFQELDVANGVGFVLVSDVYAEGDITFTGPGLVADNSPGHTLRAHNLTANDLAVNQLDIDGNLAVSGAYAVGNTQLHRHGTEHPAHPALPVPDRQRHGIARRTAHAAG